MATTHRRIRRNVRKYSPTRLRQIVSVEDAPSGAQPPDSTDSMLPDGGHAAGLAHFGQRSSMARRGAATMPQGAHSSMFAIRLLGVLALVALNAFFAATEFSLVAVRLSRIRQLVATGNARARVVELLLGDLHRVVSGVQLGITLTSLALGALGEATFAKLFQAIWMGTPGTRSAIIAHALALICAFALLSALHVVIGELVPKTLSLARAERVALMVAVPFHWFLNTFRWAISTLDGATGAIVKAMGVTSPHG